MAKSTLRLSKDAYIIAVTKRARCEDIRDIITAVMECDGLDTNDAALRRTVSDRLRKTDPTHHEFNQKQYGELYRREESRFWNEIAAHDGQALYQAGTRLPNLIRDAEVNLEKISTVEFVKLIQAIGIKHELVQKIIAAKGINRETRSTEPEPNPQSAENIAEKIKRALAGDNGDGNCD